MTIIVGFAIFAAIRRTLAFDKRLVFEGYRQATLIAAKTSAIAIVAATVAAFTSLVLLAFWRPGLSGWLAILAAFTIIALGYGAFGLFLGVLVRSDLEGFFLIIMGGLMDTFLQNPLGNPLVGNPVLEWFPSFGPTQFAVGGSLGHIALWWHLAPRRLRRRGPGHLLDPDPHPRASPLRRRPRRRSAGNTSRDGAPPLGMAVQSPAERHARRPASMPRSTPATAGRVPGTGLPSARPGSGGQDIAFLAVEVPSAGR